MVAALVLACAASPLIAQGNSPERSVPPPPAYTITRTAIVIRVDGRLDDDVWRTAPEIPIAWEWTPGDNTPPPVRTVCHLTYDQSSLYIGCRAWDPRPGDIRAHLVDRDDIERLILDDHFSIMVDPFNDQRRGFQFRVNALGSQADAMLSTAEGYEDWSWDAIWQSAGRLTDDGYEIEVALPFKSLRFPQTEGVQTWGVILERSWPRSMRHRMQSSARDRSNSCLLCEANKVTGFQGITPGRNLEVVPTATASRTDTRESFPSGAMGQGTLTPEVGGDIRWGVTSNVALNGTVNPDFSQVEADAAQLDVNTRFALFYPEKRPFFLEGADFFLTPVQAVFTRTVADPDAGLKVSGKIGRSSANAVGIFGARDAVTNLLFPSNQGTDGTSLDQESWVTAGRYRRDLGRASYVGALYTGRFGPGYTNQVGGVDVYRELWPSTSVRAQYLASGTEYPAEVAADHGQPAGLFTGGAFNVTLRHQSRDWSLTAKYEDLSPDFRADVGFVPRVDTREGYIEGARQWWRDRGWFTVLATGPFYQEIRDHQGVVTDRMGGWAVAYRGPLQSEVHLVAMLGGERYLDTFYGRNAIRLQSELKPAGGLAFGFEMQVGEAIDYANARPATQLRLVPSAMVSLGRGLALELRDLYERLSDQGEEILKQNILESRLKYQFSLRTQVRAIVQYQDVSRNQALFTEPVDNREQGLFGQFLLSYKVNPQTVLFLGYSQNSLGTQDHDLTQRDRTFFTKIGYAWRP